MKKRLWFKCWSCNKKYSLYKEITDQQELIVVCPFCNAEGVVKLGPYKTVKKMVLRGEAEADASVGSEYEFPDVIPTEKPEQV
jgi:hypothetical protein